MFIQLTDSNGEAVWINFDLVRAFTKDSNDYTHISFGGDPKTDQLWVKDDPDRIELLLTARE